MNLVKEFFIGFIQGVLISLFILGLLFIAGGLSQCARADETNPKFKIAILDTGYDPSLINGPKLKLCPSGHFDFEKGTPTIGSTDPHGTRVAAIIAQELAMEDYCAVIYSIDNYKRHGMENIISALYKAAHEGVKVINSSYSGMLTSYAEREAMKDAVSNGVEFFVAAGNTHRNLDFECLAFPACFDIGHMHVVGALDPITGLRASYSNYGVRVKEWYSGVFGNREGFGTSFAAPRALASYVRYHLNRLPPKVVTTKMPSNISATHTTNGPVLNKTLTNN